MTNTTGGKCMDKKTTGILAVVVVAVVVIAAAFVMMNKDKGGDDTDNSISFLIQDNKGFYFWIEGEGDTAIAAFQDAIGQAAYKDAAAFVASTDNTGEAYGISSLYGLSMTKDASEKWYWWSQYTWNGSAWEQAQSYMNSYGAAETNNYLAVVYGDGTNTPLAKPSDAKIWDGSTSGVKFTIKSSSGMEFYINGQGTTMLDAFKDATTDYNVPFESDTTIYGEGVGSVFGIGMDTGITEDGKTFYYYWAQYYRNSGEWGYGDGFMSAIQSSDYKECLVSYEYSVN